MPTKKLTLLSPDMSIVIPENVTQEYIRSTQVCKMFNISESQLKKLRSDGTIPAYKLGKTYLYKPEEIIAQIKKVIP